MDGKYGLVSFWKAIVKFVLKIFPGGHSVIVRFAVDVTIGGTACYIFVGSAANASSGIVLVSSLGSGQTNLYADNGQGQPPGTAMTGPFTSGTHRMSIEQYGNDVKAYIDGALVGRFTKTSVGTGMYVGYGVYGTADGTEAFDNMSLDIRVVSDTM